MSESLIRLLSLDIRNLKNVTSGRIRLTGSQDNDGFSEKADIAGIYGQNGSGKTTVIQALSLFNFFAKGLPFWSDIADCISGTSDEVSFESILDTFFETYDVHVAVMHCRQVIRCTRRLQSNMGIHKAGYKLTEQIQ
jgi:AAA15 family ATPase/GTPase